MIISQEVGEMDSKAIQAVLDSQIESGKCVEIYLENKDMIYVQKQGEKDYVYGYYPNGGNTNEEWFAKTCDTYKLDKGMTIEFTHDSLGYNETREFIITNIVKIYVGDEWSN